jgi:hypothetical protein
VAKCASDEGVLVSREGPDKAWQFPAKDSAIHGGDQLVGGAGATLDSKNGAVRLRFVGDISGTSPYPIVETAVVLHENAKMDLDLTLERGRINLTNMKARGPACVHVRIQNRMAGDITLTAPGASVTVELYGRWLPGSQFRKDPKPGEGPAVALIVLALKGEVIVKGPKHEFTLKAPPGHALIHGEDLMDPEDIKPEFLKELPAWAKPAQDNEEAKMRRAAILKFKKLAQGKSLGDALDEFVKSENKAERRSAVNVMAALDDLPRLGKALQTTKHADVWDNGIIALRAWIGRGPGQDQKLYKALVEQYKYPAKEAGIVLQLLHGFSENDLAQPDTYEILLDYLESDRLSIRGLAIWHLGRLVPAGKKFGFNPTASKEDRERAAKEWRKLIPEGKLPTKPQGDGK